ncbi:MAG: thioredoxin [Candidatus Cloacimonadales bacterium]
MIEVTEANFAEVVEKSEMLVLVDFWAPWCGPCKALAPTIDKIEKEYEGQLKVVKVNIDESPGLAGKFSVMSIPTVILFKDGQVKEQSIGLVNKSKLSKKIQPYL